MRVLDRLQTESTREAKGGLEVSPFLGTWINTNNAKRGIAKIVLATKDGALTMHAFGACDPSPHDWGEVKAEAIYADSVSSQEGMALTT